MSTDGAARILVLVPTYNEAENLRLLLDRLLELELELDVLVIDDSSPDGTGAIADAIANLDPRVRVLHRPLKLGLGGAYVAGFRSALKTGHALIVEMDADFSHRPEDLYRLVAAADRADVVIGSRNVGGGRVENWSWLRRFISRGGSCYARALLGIGPRDYTSGFKCFRRAALESLDLQKIRSGGYGFQVEVNYACSRAGLRIVEVPIVFPDRVRGVSKMSFRIAVEAALTVLRLRLWRESVAVADPARSSPQPT